MSTAGGSKPPKRTARSPLSTEDHSLWKHVAASIDKRRQGKPRVPDVELPPEPSMAPLHESRPSKPARTAKAASPSAVSARRNAPPAPKSPPPAAAPKTSVIPGVERRKVRRIAAGTIEIEDRLDLHGMTQSAAHRRLIGFLQNSAAHGLRTVLVITGKGVSRHASPRDAYWDTDEVGVLRRVVPRWLAEPPLRALVIASQPAAPRHGGDGAIYVLLRRQRR